MENVSTTTRIRQRRKRKENNRLGSFALGCGVILSLAIALSAVFTVAAYRDISEELPSPEMLPALLEPPSGLLLEPTRFYDRTGTQEIFSLSHPEAAGASYLEIDSALPLHLAPALITTTLIAGDPATWKDDGSVRGGTVEAAYNRVANNLVSDLLLHGETAGWRRDLRQRLLVDQVREQFGEDQLIEWYLNSADYGNLAFGADAASLVYFGKKASELTLAEAAILAAVSEAPALNPLDIAEEARARGRIVLKQGLEQGLINTADFRDAIDEEITFNPAAQAERQPFTAFINLVSRQLEAQFGRDQLLRGGLRVRTTLDFDLQNQVDCAIQTQLARLNGEENPFTDENGDLCEAGRLIQSFNPDEVDKFSSPAGSAVVMDPKTGEVLALAGDPIPGPDPALPPGRPPGTLLAPYVHLAAYTRGLSPASQAWDIPSSIPVALNSLNLENWQHQGPVRLRSALVNDYLAPTLQLLEQIGPDNVWGTLPQLGYTSLNGKTGASGYDLLLGGGGTTLLEVVHGYSAFSNLGLLIGEEAAGQENSNQAIEIQPVTVLQVEDSNGNLLQVSQERASRPVISSQLAYLITHSLSDESARWESMGHPNLLEVGRPAAAKIGETSDGSDIWTVGFTPNLVVGTWFGESHEAGALLGEGAAGVTEPPSAEIAAGPWHAIMQYASADLPVVAWEQPPGVSEIDVCDPSGLLPTLICPKVVNEVFLQGNEPLQLDTLYRKYLVNRETGRLATVFTPPELIEEQVYLVVPPSAIEWANESGVETPPDDYDLLFASSTTAPGVSFGSPEMFAYVQGVVPIMGTAGGTGFEYYRLQAGQGLNPQSWIQIGDDIPSDVNSGRLGVWDTEGLSGLYAVQLLVVRDDQRVDKVTIQVTVDSTAPEIQIINPSNGQEYSFPTDRSTTLQIEVSDDLALDRVEYKLDGRLFATLVEPPYTIPMALNPGSHILIVTAYDKAGNRTESRVLFTVNS